MNKQQILRDAKELIRNPRSWITGAFAEDAQGNSVAEFESEAVKFCAFGALYRQSFAQLTSRERMEVYDALQDAAARLGYTSSEELNDFGDHDEVMMMYDLAIGLADNERSEFGA